MNRKLSERLGLAPPPKLGMSEVSAELRTAVWNLIYSVFARSNILAQTSSARQIAHNLRWRVDEVGSAGGLVDRLKGVLGVSAQGIQFYEILETVAQGMRHWALPPETDTQYWARWNHVLSEDGSYFRFLQGELVPLTGPAELAEVEKAAQNAIVPIAQHIRDALRLLPPNPNSSPRNSVKEAISAVEAAFKSLTAEPAATLGDGLKLFEKRYGPLHESLRRGLEKLYAYTNGPGGIRHALVDDAVEPTVDDARFMVVTCSAFANYLVAIAAAQQPGKS